MKVSGFLPETKLARMNFSQATGQRKADANLDDYVGKNIDIAGYSVGDPVTFKGQPDPTQIVYIDTTDKKCVYTWSGVVLGQLNKMKDKGAFADNGSVFCGVEKQAGDKGKYIALTEPYEETGSRGKKASQSS